MCVTLVSCCCRKATRPCSKTTVATAPKILSPSRSIVSDIIDFQPKLVFSFNAGGLCGLLQERAEGLNF